MLIKQTTTSGQKCFEYSAHKGCLELMERILLESNSWYSFQSSLIWKMKYTEKQNIIFALTPIEKIEMPTPTVNDSRNTRLHISQKDRDSIVGYLIRRGIKGSLNPTWVEWLMGYPIGWIKV